MSFEKRLLGAAALALVVALLSSVAAAQEEPKRPPPVPGFPMGPSGRVTSFTADPSTIQPGQSSTLTWAAVNADDTSIDECVGVVPTRGSRQVSPTATTTYTFTAAGRGGTDKKSVTVTVVGTTPIEPAEGNKGCVAEKDMPVPQMDGHPDLSGVYIGGFGITNRTNPR
jgi:peptidoglycan-associated lipoprotein